MSLNLIFIEFVKLCLIYLLVSLFEFFIVYEKVFLENREIETIRYLRHFSINKNVQGKRIKKMSSSKIWFLFDYHIIKMTF